jgi:carboxyl-terminal processing protease
MKYFIGALVLSGFLGASGVWAQDSSEQVLSSQTSEASLKKLEAFAKVFGYIEQNYVEDIDPNDLLERAIEAMAQELDPHTVYLSDKAFAQMKVNTSGSFGGIGIELGLNEDKELVVMNVMKNGPARKAGLKDGDLVLAVDGQSTQGWSLSDALEQLRGPKGSKVKLSLRHDGEKEPYEVTITRKTIRLDSVESKILPGQIGYIMIRSFQSRTDEEVRDAFQSMQKKQPDLKGLILDVRNNPGGLLDQAILVADLFLSKGAIVSSRGRGNQQLEIHYAQEEGTLDPMPMVVLINEGTASASEIVAGALQDHHRAVLIGTPSFGKGSVQTIIDLEDGSALKMTIARYYTPNQRSIQNVGNRPDLYVSYFNYREDDEGFPREKDLSGRIEGVDVKKKSLSPEEKAILQDPQLKAALEYLSSWQKMTPIVKASLAKPRVSTQK